MIIKDIKLKGFRNYVLESLELDKNINIIYGRNAQGKTNLLEAMYFLFIGRGKRNNKNSELIKFDENEAFIKANINTHNYDYRIDVNLKRNLKNKGIAINGLQIKKLEELLEVSSIVYFSPDDLKIINEGPSVRRKWIDYMLSTLDKEYFSLIRDYNKILKNRNILLFKQNIDDELDIWDIKLAEYGEKIIKKRASFINELGVVINTIVNNISGNEDNLITKYENNVDEGCFLKKLKESRSKDIYYHNTNYGIHKDELGFYINDKEVRIFASQGQRKTIALALKLSEIEFIKIKKKDDPVLLLDDVLSELDSNRQNFLLESIDKLQTVITCTGLDDFVKYRYPYNKIFYCENGKLKNVN